MFFQNTIKRTCEQIKGKPKKSRYAEHLIELIKRNIVIVFEVMLLQYVGAKSSMRIQQTFTNTKGIKFQSNT